MAVPSAIVAKQQAPKPQKGERTRLVPSVLQSLPINKGTTRLKRCRDVADGLSSRGVRPMGSPTIIDWEFEDPGVLEQERFYEVIRPALEGCELPEVSLTLKGPETLRSHLLRTIVGWARKP